MNVRYFLSGVFALTAITLLGAYSSGAMSPSKTACGLGACTTECCPPGGCVEPCCPACPECCDFSSKSVADSSTPSCCQSKATSSCCAAKSNGESEKPLAGK